MLTAESIALETAEASDARAEKENKNNNNKKKKQNESWKGRNVPVLRNGVTSKQNRHSIS